jgi:putative glutamine amidotransferase
MEPDSRSAARGWTSSGDSRSISSSRPDAPLVGVTHSSDRSAHGEIIDGPAAYVAALERHGARAEPLENDLRRIEEYLERLDAIVVTGGLDVDPALYGGRRDATVDPPNADRDRFEIALIREARVRKIPLFGICRGLQAINVAFGGTLVEDLAGHRARCDGGAERFGYLEGHTVTFGDGKLRALLGAASAPTNSLHHQAVRAVAADLAAVGRTPDGVVEALEARFEHPFFFAVQWHPELLPPEDPPACRLFAQLVSAARGTLDRA